MSSFNKVVDVCIMSMRERFQTMSHVKDNFGVLLDFPNLSTDDLFEQCRTLEKTLTNDGHRDVNGYELAFELQQFPDTPKSMTSLELLTFLHEKRLQEVYPNMWVALRIAVTLPVTVASAERSFSRFK